MSELGHNTLATTFTGPKKQRQLHCTNPDCYDDDCHGECLDDELLQQLIIILEEEECCDSECGCHDQQS